MGLAWCFLSPRQLGYLVLALKITSNRALMSTGPEQHNTYLHKKEQMATNTTTPPNMTRYRWSNSANALQESQRNSVLYRMHIIAACTALRDIVLKRT